MRIYIPTLSALLLVTACASTPSGPTVAVMPPSGKPLGMFQDDDTVCRHYAAGQVDGDAAHANWMQTAVGAGGMILGAGLGAAIGGGHGAAIGAGAGALGGAAVGAVPAGKAQASLQERYDVAFSQCMVTRGNHVPSLQQALGRR
jgi:hypothetical protein